VARRRAARRHAGARPPIRDLRADGLHARASNARIAGPRGGRAPGDFRRGDPRHRHLARRRRVRAVAAADRDQQMPDALALVVGVPARRARRRAGGPGATHRRSAQPRARSRRAAGYRPRRRAAARRRGVYAPRDRPADGAHRELLEVAACPSARPAACPARRRERGNDTMRARTEDLLTLRDGEPIDAALRDRLLADPDNRREIERLARVAEDLRRLPTIEPPPDRWSRIAAAAANRPARRGRRYAAGLAGAVVAVATLF